MTLLLVYGFDGSLMLETSLMSIYTAKGLGLLAGCFWKLSAGEWDTTFYF